VIYAAIIGPVLVLLLAMRAMLVVAARTDRQSERQRARRSRGWHP
jgi:hypothetical protein